jgi:hypothetical protein
LQPALRVHAETWSSPMLLLQDDEILLLVRLFAGWVSTSC